MAIFIGETHEKMVEPGNPVGPGAQPHLSHFQGTSPEASLCKGVQKGCNGGQKHHKLRTNGVYLPINMVISQSDMVIYHHLANKDVDLTLW